MKKMLLLSEMLIFAILLGTSEKAKAIPAFARKYKTSCMTCHAAFPKLNAFGNAFRQLGYRFPEGQDVQMIKQEPIKMGADAYKQVWPDAVWPSDIPQSSPIAFILESEVLVDMESDDASVSFSHLMGEAEVLIGGTIGDDINFLAALEAGEEGLEIEMGYVGIYNILDRKRLNLKIGQLPPEVLFVSNHRRFGPNYWITSRTVADNEWSLEGSQKGFEASGLLAKGRLNYNVGLVEGSGNILNSYKDSYAHLAYKWRGLAYDGTGEVQGRQLWGDNSLQIGGFVYLGNAELIGGQENTFRMIGGDMAFNYQNLKLNGGIAFRTDDNPFVDNLQENISANSRIYFLEANYMIYPWLIPTLRYESWIVDKENGESIENQQRFVPTVQVLMRANVHAFSSMEIEEEANAYEIGEIEFGLQFGF